MEVYETLLPGIGSRYEFTTRSGDHLAVVVRRDRRRELVVYDRADPDACRSSVELTTEETAVIAELLGGTKLTERLSHLHHEVEGLAIEWVTIASGSSHVAQTIGDTKLRSATGASIVAVIRDGRSIPGPGPEFRFAAGDVILIMGSNDSVRAATNLLSG